MKEEGFHIEQEYRRLEAEKQERIKELTCINKTTTILRQGKPLDETLQQLVLIFPHAWQFPEYTCARIIYNGQEYVSPDFTVTQWKQTQSFKAMDDISGSIEVYYTREYPLTDEGPFLKEERDLIINLANIISSYISNYKAREIIEGIQPQEPGKEDVVEEEKVPPASRQLLQSFLDKQNAARYVFHDLMPFRVKEILLVATMYDIFAIQGEGRITDGIFSDYPQMSLISAPRITGVSSADEAFERLKRKHYDLVILMMGVDKKTPLEFSCKIKKVFPYVPVFLLLNNSKDFHVFESNPECLQSLDQVYVWNGDTRMFSAMVKLLEDKINVGNDTRVGLTRVILLVEDSAVYYSRYLPMLYSIVQEQTQRIIEDVGSDDVYKVLKMRARPKILLSRTYEEAIGIFNRYRDYLLCIISDVRFSRNGQMDEKAGIDLIGYVKREVPNLPAVLQSSDPGNTHLAYEVQATFIDKNSDTLLQDLRSFINYYLGFGHFVYRDQQGKQIAVARSMKEFEQYLRTVPEESLVYHAVKNHFSLWLMARGEIQIAKMLHPLRITDFRSPAELREFLLQILHKYRYEKDRGKIVAFEETALLDPSNIVSMAGGSLGGKGRGLAFINTLIYDVEFTRITPHIRVCTPLTSVIGTDEFEIFMERNHLYDKVKGENNHENIRQAFLEGSLSYTMEKSLRTLLRVITRPLAIRSSSLFEDSLMQPFSGIYDTYLLPNNHPDFEIRYRQASNAIKLVYASVYSDDARTYFKAINHNIDEEKMAVVIQEVVGNSYGDYYYPHLSGTAQSFNYYPVSHMKPEEGFAVVAVGLGQYVMQGEKAFRFAPLYPALDICSPRDLFKNSQVWMYAINMANRNLNLLEGEDAGLSRLDISVVEKHGTLLHCASVYDAANDRVVPGLDLAGPRIIDFSDILKYNYIPLAEAINTILTVVKEALGCAVEIEYAVDLNKDSSGRASFYLLQIKPLLGAMGDYEIDLQKINKDNILLSSGRSMGNGIIENISDIIFVDPGKFDNARTLEMVSEIAGLNKQMLEEGRNYVLIGPGRWGTRDRFIGIPVAWPQISNARVIVETSRKDTPLDASLGSHFFHNVTSMNVGYFSVDQTMPGDFIRWDLINDQTPVRQTRFFKQVRFGKPLIVKMDGKKRISVITLEGNN